MSIQQTTFRARFIRSITTVPRDDWNGITGIDYPFTRHEFFEALESSGATNTQSGWQPNHMLLYSDDRLVGVLPLYLKYHSYGEYVFDWSWADAWQRAGIDYYPKLLSAIPFTPANGPRLCLLPSVDAKAAFEFVSSALEKHAEKQGISSVHVLFSELAESERWAANQFGTRYAVQFHWFNRNYSDFEAFLDGFNSRKRKNLRKERQRVVDQGIDVWRIEGRDINDAQWSSFYRFYQLTYAKRSGHGGYLSEGFFRRVGDVMPDQLMMVLAIKEGEPVAAALNFKSKDTLYGRYWGCSQEFDYLHFEACYYQGIEYCIEQGLKVFNPGAQGEHKIQRGFEPILTRSNHWVAHPGLGQAVAQFLDRERDHIEDYRQQAAALLPFKKAD